MFKKILIPLDGSELAEQALPVAGQFMRETDAEATLFAVGSPPKGTPRRTKIRRATPLASTPGAFPGGVIAGETPGYAETKDQAVERVENELREYLDVAAHQLEGLGHPVHTAVRLGDPAGEIVAFAQKSEVDLIVMATHGRSGLSEALHGSVTASVVRSGVTPVLVIRPEPGRKAERRRHEPGDPLPQA